MDYLTAEAYSLFAPRRAYEPSRIFVTCEHASMRLPEPYRWTAGDLSSGVIGTHWSVDIGAERLSRDLSERLGCRGIAARFCRLFCDANRAIGEDTMFRTSVEEGKIPIGINQNLTEEETRRRLALYYEPYHNEICLYVDSTAEPIDFVFSIHSFTPVYEGQVRKVEVGVLYRDPIDEPLAMKMNDLLLRKGFVSRINEPWSGMTALADSSTVHARAKRVSNGSPNLARSLLLEVRQDLVIKDDFRAKLVETLAEVLLDPAEKLVGQPPSQRL
ncbi:hypothetical protein DFJ74DRAFT_694141 [Hyaloraphidium curvatum]|nr:hypothetical protein DFJ74DRAFT_694141 [Hyaloraphidium curvatum]